MSPRWRTARRVGRSAHRLLRWAGALAAIAILILSVGIWRLMQGPIELNWLAPYVEAAIERSNVGLGVTVSGVRFGIDRTTHQFDLQTENVRLTSPDGQPVASFPEMAMSFGLGPLLRGWLAPTELVVERPVLHLTRDAGGAFSARIGAEDQVGGDLGPQLLEQLTLPPGRDTALGMLRRVSIRGATVIVDDQQSGRIWRADRVDIAVERGAHGIRGDVSFAVPLGSSMPELRASFEHLSERGLLDLDITIAGVQPSQIPPLIPELAQLRHVEAPVSGTLRTRIDVAKGIAQGSRLDLRLGGGALRSDWLPAGSVAIEKGELRATYAPERDEVRVERLALDLGGGTELALDGTFAGVTPELIAAATAETRPRVTVRGDLAVAIRQVPLARVGELWPVNFGAGGRRWTLANIQDGTIEEAAVQLTADLDPANHVATVTNAAGQMRYRDATVTYFRGLPPVRRVGGTASFQGNQLEFTPSGGGVKGIRIIGGSLLLTNLGEPTEWLTIDLALAGPLQDALEIIDTKPLSLMRAVGIDSGQVGGRAEAQLRFRMPMVDELKLDMVEYGVKATLSGTSLAKVALDRGIRDGNFTLDIARTGAQLRGTARFDDIPAKLDANFLFRARDGVNATYRVQMALDDAAQRRLELNVAPDRLSGPILLDATYKALAANRGEAVASFDLRDATLSIPEAGWQKTRGQPGSAKLVLDLDNERITRIRQIEIGAPGLDGRLTALLGADRKQLERVDINRLTIGDSDLSGVVARRAGGGWRADIHAVRLDARRLIKDATVSTPATVSPPLAVHARIDRLILAPKRELHHVGAELMRSGGVWRTGRIEGRQAGGQPLSLRFGEGGGHRLVFRSDDLGATLKLLDVADNIVGGRVTLDGHLTESNGRRQLRARIEGENYVVMRASIMARLLALPSLTGLASTLSGAGLPFSRLSGELHYNGSQVRVERLLAFGESLGITGEGWIDIDRDRLELRGTVAPAYLVNSLLGNMPIIGPLLGGGSQGLIAANYRLNGSTADPDIAVNPLSALTPGILRQIFAPLVGFPPVPDQQAQQAQ